MKLKLHWQIFIGLAAGIVFGLTSGFTGFERLVIEDISLPGSVLGRPPGELSARRACVDFDGPRALGRRDRFAIIRRRTDLF